MWKTKYTLGVITVLVSNLGSNAWAQQWARSDGPGGGQLRALIAQGEILVAGTSERGIYRSTNDGVLWQESNQGLPRFTTVQCFTVKGDTIFAGTYARGVYRSTDGANSWSAVNTNLPPLAQEVNVLLTVGNTIFLGASFGGEIWFSLDGGDTWSKRSNGLSQFGHIYSMAYRGGRIFAATAPQGALKSDNMGQTWEQLFIPIGVGIFHTTADYVFAAGRGEGIRRSNDNGITWTDVSSGLPLAALVINTMISHRDRIYISTPGGVYQSVDWGNTWSYSNNGLPQSTYSNQVTSFLSHGNSLFAATLGSGVYKETDGRWIEHNKGLAITNVRRLQYENQRVYAATDGSGLFYLNTLTGQWETLDTNRTFTSFRALAVSTDRIYAGTVGGVYKSLDVGKTWSLSNLSAGFRVYVRALAIVGNTVVVGLEDPPGVLISFNNGLTWVVRNNGLPAQAQAVYELVHNNGVLFAGTSAGVYKSTNMGNDWSLKIGAPYTWSLFVADDQLFVGSFGGGIIRSSLRGEDWTWINSGITEGWITSIVGRRNLFFASSLIYGKVFMSTDCGDHWMDVSNGLPDNVGVRTLGLDENFLYAGLDRYGVWRLPLAETPTTVPCLDIPPNNFQLYQNYPNPFNPFTTITYELPTLSHVTLKIFNVLGQEVASLVEGQKEGGRYQVPWYASGLPSGVYFYQLQAGGFVENRKMVLIK